MTGSVRVDRARIALAATVAAALAALALSTAASPAAPTVGDGKGGVKLRKVDNFAMPVYATGAPGRANRKLLFVVERGGTVRIVRGERTLKRPFIDIGSKISTGGEQGLLSIAFDPGYAHNRRFYLYFADKQGNIRVDGFRRSKKRKTVAKRRGRKVISVPHGESTNHYGGTVAFDPDGHLWLGTGDGGSFCDPPENAQNTDSLLGKLLRIDPKPRGGYSIPNGNPFAGGAGRDEIYATGLRNPFRFSFDRKTKTVAIGDVGQNTTEEVDYETIAATAGANFGWDAFEGDEPLTLSNSGLACGGDGDTPPPPDHVRPIHTYAHQGSGHTGCSITGGIIVRDRSLKSLYGRYVFSDFCNGDLRSLIPSTPRARGERSAGIDLGSPVSFAPGPGGHVYVTSILGEVSRLAPAR